MMVAMSDEGVQFAAAADGLRSTSTTARDVLAAAVRAVDPELAARIEHEKAWRKTYPGHLRRLTEVSASTPDAAHVIARTGLAALHSRFEFVRDGKSRPLLEAVGEDTDVPAATETAIGSATSPNELVVPVGSERLRGEALRDRVNDWVRRGLVEPTFATAISQVMDHPEWLDLSGRTFALLGGGGEMSPLGSLLRWGADVAVVDLPRPSVWRHILDLAEQGSGRLHVPVLPQRAGAAELVDRAGIDLLVDAPAARQWLAGLAGPVVLGNYAYADGAHFVRVAMAADAIAASLLEARDDISLAYLATPTDVFAVPPEVVADARARTATTSTAWRILGSPMRLGTAGRAFVPHYRSTVRDSSGRELGIADTLIAQQGPNYALAKRLQRWRAITTRYDGVWSSAHIAPPSRTRSVTKNRVLAAAYTGSTRLGVEAFEPATSSVLMAAVLVRDLNDPTSPANPGIDLPGGEDLFMDAAAHGGLWRLPWEPRSVLPIAVLLGARQLVGHR
jgi:hypothetical protein